MPAPGPRRARGPRRAPALRGPDRAGARRGAGPGGGEARARRARARPQGRDRTRRAGSDATRPRSRRPATRSPSRLPSAGPRGSWSWAACASVAIATPGGRPRSAGAGAPEESRRRGRAAPEGGAAGGGQPQRGRGEDLRAPRRRLPGRGRGRHRALAARLGGVVPRQSRREHRALERGSCRPRAAWGASRESATYWLGRAWERRGDRDQAARQFNTLVRDAPRSYYGILAARRVASPRCPRRRRPRSPSPPIRWRPSRATRVRADEALQPWGSTISRRRRWTSWCADPGRYAPPLCAGHRLAGFAPLPLAEDHAPPLPRPGAERRAARPGRSGKPSIRSAGAPRSTRRRPARPSIPIWWRRWCARSRPTTRRPAPGWGRAASCSSCPTRPSPWRASAVCPSTTAPSSTSPSPISRWAARTSPGSSRSSGTRASPWPRTTRAPLRCASGGRRAPPTISRCGWTRSRTTRRGPWSAVMASSLGVAAPPIYGGEPGFLILRPAPLWRLAAAAALDALIGLVTWSLAAMWLTIAVLHFRRDPDLLGRDPGRGRGGSRGTAIVPPRAPRGSMSPGRCARRGPRRAASR